LRRVTDRREGAEHRLKDLQTKHSQLRSNIQQGSRDLDTVCLRQYRTKDKLNQANANLQDSQTAEAEIEGRRNQSRARLAFLANREKDLNTARELGAADLSTTQQRISDVQSQIQQERVNANRKEADVRQRRRAADLAKKSHELATEAERVAQNAVLEAGIADVHVLWRHQRVRVRQQTASNQLNSARAENANLQNDNIFRQDSEFLRPNTNP
jgi:chromosome segregation ATPase